MACPTCKDDPRGVPMYGIPAHLAAFFKPCPAPHPKPVNPVTPPAATAR